MNSAHNFPYFICAKSSRKKYKLISSYSSIQYLHYLHIISMYNYLHIPTYRDKHIHICIHTCTHIYTYTCIHTHLQIHTYIPTYNTLPKHVPPPIHIITHTHTHTPFYGWTHHGLIHLQNLLLHPCSFLPDLHNTQNSVHIYILFICQHLVMIKALPHTCTLRE